MTKKKMRATRFPGVRRIAPGEYLVRYKERDPRTGRVRDRKARIPATSAAEAARKRSDLMADGDLVVPTVECFAISWLTLKIPTLAHSTRVHYAGVLDNHILPTFGPIRIDAVTRTQVIAWRNGIDRKPATANTLLRAFKTLMGDAAAEYGFSDPTARVPALPEDTERDDDDTKVLTPAELRAVLRAVQTHRPRWYPITLTLALTGARWGAVSALKWSDIDFVKSEILIRRSHYRGKIKAGTKTGKRKRIPMLPVHSDTLRDLRTQQVRDQVRGLEHGWVFPSRVGGLMQPSSLRDPIRRSCELEGIERIPTAHWFRYSASSLLRRVGEGMVQRAITGHSTVEMAEHYDHVRIDEKRAALEAAWELVAR